MNGRNKASIDQELFVLEAQLEILRKRENEYNILLADIQRTKDTITDERKQLETKQRDLKARMEPINWLPPELLLQIFQELDYSAAEGLSSLLLRSSVVLSHVCKHWRTLTLGNPLLWTSLTYQGSVWNPTAAQVFLERSGLALLSITFRGSANVLTHEETRRVRMMLQDLAPQLSRVESFNIHSTSPDAMMKVLRLFNDPSCNFAELRSVVLSVMSPDPMPGHSRAITTKFVSFRDEDPAIAERPLWTKLRRLKLRQLPLLNFPTEFLSNLRCLQLTYPPTKRVVTLRVHYFLLLRMSSLLQLLTLTPLLEELNLENTVPFFDTILPTSPEELDGNIVDEKKVVRPVKLSHLRSIDWSFPFPPDVHRLLSFLDTPMLENLDLWVEEFPGKRADIAHIRGYNAFSPWEGLSVHDAIIFPSLRDLSLQSSGDDATCSVLRRFVFPSLEKLEITNAARISRAMNGPVSTLPVFPRLESIFRDPRLPLLTHLTLSHFQISPEHGRVEALLGYMPILTSLSFDACIGVGILMEGLQEKVVGTIKRHAQGGSVRTRRGVKVCPRLEALSFWGCQDVDIKNLRAVVLARNGNIKQEKDCAEEQGASVAPNGENLSVTGSNPNGKGGNEAEEATMGRMIKPLRKIRVQGQGTMSRSLGLLSSPETSVPSTSVVPILDDTEEEITSAHIIFVRIIGCHEVEHAEAMSLKDLGVVDVIWSGSETA